MLLFIFKIFAYFNGFKKWHIFRTHHNNILIYSKIIVMYSQPEVKGWISIDNFG